MKLKRTRIDSFLQGSLEDEIANWLAAEPENDEEEEEIVQPASKVQRVNDPDN